MKKKGWAFPVAFLVIVVALIIIYVFFTYAHSSLMGIQETNSTFYNTTSDALSGIDLLGTGMWILVFPVLGIVIIVWFISFIIKGFGNGRVV